MRHNNPQRNVHLSTMEQVCVIFKKMGLFIRKMWMLMENTTRTQIPFYFCFCSALLFCPSDESSSNLPVCWTTLPWRGWYLLQNLTAPTAPLSSKFKTLQPGRSLSLGLAALGVSSGAGRGAKTSLVAPPALTQHKVIVGGGAHGIKHVGFVGDLELWRRKRNEVMKSCSVFFN